MKKEIVKNSAKKWQRSAWTQPHLFQCDLLLLRNRPKIPVKNVGADLEEFLGEKPNILHTMLHAWESIFMFLPFYEKNSFAPLPHLIFLCHHPSTCSSESEKNLKNSFVNRKDDGNQSPKILPSGINAVSLIPSATWFKNVF